MQCKMSKLVMVILFMCHVNRDSSITADNWWKLCVGIKPLWGNTLSLWYNKGQSRGRLLEKNTGCLYSNLRFVTLIAIISEIMSTIIDGKKMSKDFV